MKPTILIHQMGKVGSTTLLENLNDHYRGGVYHTHFLNRARLNDQIQRQPEGRKLLGHLSNSLEVNRILSGADDKLIKVISLLREPVSRNISAYFQNLGNKKDWDLKDLIAHFLASYCHELPLKWFDWEIRDVFGIDVYRKTFDMGCGWQEYHENGIDLLVIRLENLNDVMQNGVIQDFIGDQTIVFEKSSSNKATDKDYRELYTKFKKQISIPKDYLDSMYDSKYAKHFYSTKELDSFRRKWIALD